MTTTLLSLVLLCLQRQLSSERHAHHRGLCNAAAAAVTPAAVVAVQQQQQLPRQQQQSRRELGIVCFGRDRQIVAAMAVSQRDKDRQTDKQTDRKVHWMSSSLTNVKTYPTQLPIAGTDFVSGGACGGNLDPGSIQREQGKQRGQSVGWRDWGI